MSSSRIIRSAFVVLIVVLVAAACGSDAEEQVLSGLVDSAPDVDPEDEEPAEVEPEQEEPAVDRAGIDLSLERADVDCSDEGLGSTETNEFFNAHYVVDGQLGAVCFGEEDATLIQAWEELAIITPPLQLA